MNWPVRISGLECDRPLRFGWFSDSQHRLDKTGPVCSVFPISVCDLIPAVINCTPPMTTKPMTTMQPRIVILAVLALCLSMFNVPFITTYAQGTAFTYQGRLQNNGTPANGAYDFRFKLAAD